MIIRIYTIYKVNFLKAIDHEYIIQAIIKRKYSSLSFLISCFGYGSYKGEHARPQTALTRMAPTPQPSAVPEPSPASQGPAPAQVFDLLAAAGGQDFNKRLLYIAECVGGKPSAPEPLPLSAEIRVMAISPAAAATGKK